MKNQEQIDRQIKGLEKMKAKLPEVNFFGENNHEPIDAQIAILQGESDYEDFENEEYQIESKAYEAREWMDSDEDDDEDLFE